MTLIGFILILLVAATVYYGVTLAMAGAWKQLVMLAIGLVLALWILSALGLALPSLPALK